MASIKRKAAAGTKKSASKPEKKTPMMTVEEIIVMRERFTEWAGIEALDDSFRHRCAETSLQITLFLSNPDEEGARKIVDSILAASNEAAAEMQRMALVGQCARGMFDAAKADNHGRWVTSFADLLRLLSGSQQRLIMRNFMDQGIGTLAELCSMPKVFAPAPSSIN